jgi:hypothetical protein
MIVEDLDDTVPFVKVLLRAKPAKVIAVCYDDHWFLCGCSYKEELEILWSVFVSSLFKVLVELY